MPKWKAIFPNQVRFSRNFGFLRRFLRLAGKIFGFLKTPFVPFIVLKTTVSMPRFQCKNRFEKRTALGRDIWEKPKWGCGLVWRAMFKNIFANISGQGGPFFKPIFALKPWDRDGRFEYNKRYKQSFYKTEDFSREHQKSPQKPKIAGKPDLIGKNGFSFRHLWLLIE